MKPARIIYIPLQFAQLLLTLNAGIWLVFGFISLARLAGGDSGREILYNVVTLLMFGNAGVLVLSAWLLRLRRRFTFFFALGVLLVNLVTTFTDQFGFLDLSTLLLDLLILGILLAKRSRFFPPLPPQKQAVEEIQRQFT